MSSPKWTPEEIALAKRMQRVFRRATVRATGDFPWNAHDLSWGNLADTEQEGFCALARYSIKRGDDRWFAGFDFASGIVAEGDR